MNSGHMKQQVISNPVESKLLTISLLDFMKSYGLSVVISFHHDMLFEIESIILIANKIMDYLIQHRMYVEANGVVYRLLYRRESY